MTTFGGTARTSDDLYSPAGRPGHAWSLFLAFAVFGTGLLALNPDPWVLLGGWFTLLIGMALLWRPGDSPIFLLLFGYQWLQTNIKPLYAMIVGVPLQELSLFGADLSSTINISNYCLVALAVGLHIGSGPQDHRAIEAATAQARSVPMKHWVRLYAAGWVIAAAFSFGTSFAEGLRQPFLALTGLRWCLFFMITYAAFSRRPIWKPWWLLFSAELGLSLGGFFATFTLPMFFAVMGVVASTKGRFTGKQVASIASLGAVALVIAVVWTAIKQDYRQFLNAGSGQQEIVVERGESVAYFITLVRGLDGPTLSAAVDQFAFRLSYVDYFAAVKQHVPANVEHTNGELLADAFLRVVQPRFLFPNKSAVHDSYRTIQFTGMEVATVERGSSISIGYFAESYIDFGVWLMVAPILLLGMVMGRFYRVMQRWRLTCGLWGMGLSSTALVAAIALETSITKLVPSLALGMLGCLLIGRLLVPVLNARFAPGIAKSLTTRDPREAAVLEKVVSPRSMP